MELEEVKDVLSEYVKSKKVFQYINSKELVDFNEMSDKKEVIENLPYLNIVSAKTVLTLMTSIEEPLINYVGYMIYKKTIEELKAVQDNQYMYSLEDVLGWLSVLKNDRILRPLTLLQLKKILEYGDLHYEE